MDFVNSYLHVGHSISNKMMMTLPEVGGSLLARLIMF